MHHRSRAICWLLFLASRAYLFTHAHGRNLDIYSYFADIVSVGRDPYRVIGGPIAAMNADYPPFLMVAFGAPAQWVSGRLAVVMLCLLGDFTLWMLALRLAKSRTGLDHAATVALVLANPLYIAIELVNLQYKTWVTAGFVALYIAPSAITLGAISGAFVLPAAMIPLRAMRDRCWRSAALATSIALMMWLPFLPSAAHAIFSHRSDRSAFAPSNDSLMQLVPDTLQPWLLVVAVAVAIACLIPRRNLALQCSAALSVIATLSSESQLNRCMSFALAVLIAAPASGFERLCSFGACAIALAAYENRWMLGAAPVNLVLMHLPIAIAVWMAMRAQPETSQ